MKMTGDIVELNYKGNSDEAKAARIALNLILNSGECDLPQPAHDYYINLLDMAEAEAWESEHDT